MFITTRRCVIRNFKSDDAGMLYKALSDAAVMQYIEPIFDMDKTKSFIEEYGMCTPPLVYAVEWSETKEVIGHVICHLYGENSYEIGWVLRREYWGMGIADELTRSLVEYLKGITDYCIIECDEHQTASAKIAINNGFECIGKENGLDIYKLKLQQ